MDKHQDPEAAETAQIKETPAVDLPRLVRCWSCNGSGVGSLAILNTANKAIPCDRCQGTGECPEIMREWESLGRERKTIRLNNGLALREWAKIHGYAIMDASRAERGLIDPRTLSANAKAMAAADKSTPTTQSNV